MTKTWWNIETGDPAVFEDSEDLANWPDFQESNPAVPLTSEGAEAIRSRILTATEWWGTDGHTMTDEQSQYRQDLQSLHSHANWPDLSESDWPVFPGV